MEETYIFHVHPPYTGRDIIRLLAGQLEESKLHVSFIYNLLQ